MAEITLDLASSELGRLVQAQIQAAVAETLGKDPRLLVEAVVNKALQEPSRSGGYGTERKTIFQDEVERMIRDEAIAAFREWLEGKRETFRELIRARLEGADGRSTLDTLIDGLAGAFTQNLHVGVTLNLPRLDDSYDR